MKRGENTWLVNLKAPKRVARAGKAAREVSKSKWFY